MNIEFCIVKSTVVNWGPFKVLGWRKGSGTIALLGYLIQWRRSA